MRPPPASLTEPESRPLIQTSPRPYKVNSCGTPGVVEQMATRGSTLTNGIRASVKDGVDRAVSGELQGSNTSDGGFKDRK